MRRLLGTLLLIPVLSAGALSACGSETGDTDGTDGADSSLEDSPTSDTPTSDSPTSDTPTDAEPGADVVEIVSETAAGGRTGESAVRVDLPAGLARLTRDFRTPLLTDKISSVVARIRLAEGQALYGAVIAVGCDVPPSAFVEVTDGKVVITAGKIVSPLPECFAPVTSVAIAVVDLPLG